MQPFSTVLTIVLLLAINTINAVPQHFRQRRQQPFDPANPDIQAAIEKVFSTPPNRGFGVVVTPDPTFVPTTAPQTLLTDNNQQCTCVPYHMCDPSNNTVREMAEDNAVTGFGLIDIRFDPLDCQDVLDVCCLGVNQREEPIVPVQPTNKPTRAAGCGIRNVGGLDFQITGAFVSDLYLFDSVLRTETIKFLTILFFSSQDNEAGFGEFPWTVALIRIEDDACLCGGSLIHPKAIITGNHCVSK